MSPGLTYVSCPAVPGSMVVGAQLRRLRHVRRVRRRLRDVRQPHPRGFDGRQRLVHVDRVRQPAQRCRVERGVDRRELDQSELVEEGGLSVAASGSAPQSRPAHWVENSRA